MHVATLENSSCFGVGATICGSKTPGGRGKTFSFYMDRSRSEKFPLKCENAVLHVIPWVNVDAPSSSSLGCVCTRKRSINPHILL